MKGYSRILAHLYYLFININFPILMKKETVKKIINLVITILTAIASAFCVQSCRG